MAKLFTAQTANANSAQFAAGALVGVQQFNTLYFNGTWDTASLKLQSTPDGGTTWFDVPGAVYTVDTDGPVNISIMATHLRFNLSSVGAGTSIDAWII